MPSETTTARRGDPFRRLLPGGAAEALAATDRPIAAALAALVFACVVVGAELARASGDISSFVRAAPPWAERGSVPAGLRVGSQPYDGVFYYRLALDPLTDRVTDRGVTLDLPAYRQQRILYPSLAWLASGADASHVPVALVLVNVVALTCIGWLSGVISRRAGRHALWGSLLFLYPGFVITLTNDLTEIVAGTLLLAGVALVRSDRPVAGAGALAMAVLARETAVLFAAVSGFARAVAAPRSWTRWAPFAVPPLVLVGWQLTLALRWDVPPIGQSAAAFDPPLLGLLAAAWLNGERLRPADALLWSAIVGFVLAMIAIGVRAVRSARPHERAAWYAYLALACVLEANIWANEAALRTLTELALLTGAMALAASARVRLSLLALEVGLAATLIAAGAPV